jgi:hypothetical protein
MQSTQDSTIVEMVRDARAAGGRDRFSCSLAQWHWLMKLAREFGWQPLGTTYEAVRDSIVDAAPRDYEPGEAIDRKLVSRQDAIALGAALLQGRDSAVMQDKLRAEELHTLISEFAQYAFGGAFLLARGEPVSTVEDRSR